MNDADPFEHFGEQMRSQEIIEECRETLLAEARQALHDNPSLDPVALVFDPDTRDAEAIRAEIARATGQSPKTGMLMAIVPRAFVLQALRINSPAALDWLPESRRGEQRMLPVAAYTRHGVRFAAFPLD